MAKQIEKNPTYPPIEEFKNWYSRTTGYFKKFKWMHYTYQLTNIVVSEVWSWVKIAGHRKHIQYNYIYKMLKGKGNNVI